MGCGGSLRINMRAHAPASSSSVGCGWPAAPGRCRRRGQSCLQMHACSCQSLCLPPTPWRVHNGCWFVPTGHRPQYLPIPEIIVVVPKFSGPPWVGAQFGQQHIYRCHRRSCLYNILPLEQGIEILLLLSNLPPLPIPIESITKEEQFECMEKWFNSSIGTRRCGITRRGMELTLAVWRQGRPSLKAATFIVRGIRRVRMAHLWQGTFAPMVQGGGISSWRRTRKGKYPQYLLSLRRWVFVPMGDAEQQWWQCCWRHWQKQ